MKITELKKISAKKNTFKVSFDNEESVILTPETIVKFGLTSGAEISKNDFDAISAYDKSNSVTADALALVSKRSYSAKSLEQKLIEKGYEPHNAKTAVKRLEELNYINDEKYADMLAKYLSGRAKGEFAIKQALEEKGISRELINKALDSLKTEAEPYEQIIETVKRKFKDFNPKDKNEVRRIASFFLRRGFTSEDISKALRNYKSSVELDVF
ncbi:MAG: recombination regulator RecX [Endomicrobia bacterium]|nr:recombination regulator RecX [Endomicrobiia bacterium]